MHIQALEWKKKIKALQHTNKRRDKSITWTLAAVYSPATCLSCITSDAAVEAMNGCRGRWSSEAYLAGGGRRTGAREVAGEAAAAAGGAARAGALARGGAAASGGCLGTRGKGAGGAAGGSRGRAGSGCGEAEARRESEVERQKRGGIVSSRAKKKTHLLKLFPRAEAFTTGRRWRGGQPVFYFTEVCKMRCFRNKNARLVFKIISLS